MHDGSLTNMDKARPLLLSQRFAGSQSLRSYDRNDASILSRPACLCAGLHLCEQTTVSLNKPALLRSGRHFSKQTAIPLSVRLWHMA